MLLSWFYKEKNTQKEDYGKTVKALKNKRLEIVSNVLTNSYDIRKSINKLNGREKSDITFEQLSEFPLDEWTLINDKIKTKSVFKSDNRIVFESEILKGAEVAPHIHSNCVEIIDVHSGVMLDASTGTKYIEGESVEYSRGVQHNLIALEDLFVIATVTK